MKLYVIYGGVLIHDNWMKKRKILEMLDQLSIFEEREKINED